MKGPFRRGCVAHPVFQKQILLLLSSNESGKKRRNKVQKALQRSAKLFSSRADHMTLGLKPNAVFTFAKQAQSNLAEPRPGCDHL